MLFVVYIKYKYIASHFNGYSGKLSTDLADYLAGEHATTVWTIRTQRTWTRAFDFFSMVPSVRATAELKLGERCSVRAPTTPLTLPVLIAFVCSVQCRLRGAHACGGILIGRFVLLRSVDISKVRCIDVVLRGSCYSSTNIRLGKPTNNREECAELTQNFVAERELCYRMKFPGCCPYHKLFGFAK